MLNQIFSLIVIIICFFYYSSFIALPAFLLNKQNNIMPLITNNLVLTISEELIHNFKTEIYYNKELNLINKPNKIDILVLNHPTSFDIFLVYLILKNYKPEDIIFVGKNTISYIPFIGLIYDNHIKISRDWKDDEELLINQIKKINNGIIVIFPEGTRFDNNKLIEGRKFSEINNYPIYDNLLVPKAKGLWTIYNYLKNANKIGNLYDITIISEKYLKKKAYFKHIIKNPFGNIFVVNREISIDKNIDNYNDFKLWLLNIWSEKDNIINNYKNNNYEKMNFDNYKYNHIYKISVIIIFIYFLTFKYIRYYLLFALIVSYIIIFYKKYRKYK